MKSSKSITQSTLRKIIRDILSERVLHEKDENTYTPGVKFDTLEKAAKESYEAAVAQLDVWNKTSNAITKWDADPRGPKAKIDALGPKPKFPQGMSGTSGASLKKALEKAQNNYSEYNPEFKNYEYSKSSSDEKYEKIMPDKNKKSYLDINDVKAGEWTPWPLAIKKSKLNFGSMKTGEAARSKGPGEDWLEYIFGGASQGASVPFDLVMPDGSVWEIKALENPSEAIRPGVEGRKEYAIAKNRMNAIMKQMGNFIITAKTPGFFEKEDFSEVDVKIINFVQVFIEDNYDLIVDKGEISRERTIALRGVLNSLGKFIIYHGKKNDDPHIKTTVSLNDKKVNVDKPTFIDIAKKLEKATGDKTILTGFEKFDILISTLKDPAFANATEFINSWFNSININKVFEQVDGVIIVNTRGFMKIPRNKFNMIQFSHVSQGMPRFIVNAAWN